MNDKHIRTWKDSLYVGPPPRSGSRALQQWQKSLQKNSITYVVTLADRKELKQLSPEYAKLMTAAEQRKAEKNREPWKIFEAPIPKDELPTGEEYARFWSIAYHVANTVSEHGRVYVHAADDTARVGLFVGAVLRILKIPKTKVVETLGELGTPLETPEQTKMINAPVPDDSEWCEFFNQEIDTDNTATHVNESITDRSARIRAKHREAPPHIHCDCYLSQADARKTHPSLKQYGLSSVFHAFSETWEKTTSAQKYAALRSRMNSDGQVEELQALSDLKTKFILRTSRIEFDLGCLGSTMRYPDIGFIVAGSLLLQSAIDDSFALPLSKKDFKAVHERMHALRLQSERNKATTRLSRHGVARLGRAHLDNGCVESDSLSLQGKLDHIARVIETGVPLLDAVMVYYKECDRPSTRYRLNRIAPNLFTLTEMALMPDLFRE